MKFVSSLCWISKGCGKTPKRLKMTKKELKQILNQNMLSGLNNGDDEEEDDENDDDRDEKEENQTANNKAVSKKSKKKAKKEEESDTDDEDKDNEDTDQKYNLDDYDDENEDLRMDPLSSLACFACNDDDDYLDKKHRNDDSDSEDFQIKSTDNILICGHSDEDVCTLNAYVYNDVECSFYIHHDLILSSFPLCIEWLDFDPTVADPTVDKVNYIAVGTLNPWIEIWDLDIIDILEPEFILGSNITSKKKKNGKASAEGSKKSKLKGHTKAVLDLKWNRLNRHLLASSSADKTICLWDLNRMKQATKIRNHTKKIQTIEFHTEEAFLLLAGSFDRTAVLYDLRNPKENRKSWSMESGIERVLWNHFSPNQFLCGDSGGCVALFDIRNDNSPLKTMKAHDKAVCGLALSSKCPNLLVTSSEDELVKIWDIKECQQQQANEEEEPFELIFEKNLKIGPINCSKPSPDSGFVFSFGGAEAGEPSIWDIREVKNVREKFYPRMNLVDEEVEEEKDASASNGGEKQKKKKKRDRAHSFKMNRKLLKQEQKRLSSSKSNRITDRKQKMKNKKNKKNLKLKSLNKN